MIKKDGKEKKLKKWYGQTTTSDVSRIGVGKDEALLYHSWSAIGNYCGSEFIYLRNSNNVWKIEKRETVVIC